MKEANSSSDRRPSQCLTMSLIAECTATDSSAVGEGGDSDGRVDGMLKTEILRLDWQRIASIQNLDVFTNVRELYLQHNRIERIEELGTLRSLEFLALGSNRICRVENLRHLNKIRVLDLSNNMVEDFDMQELPHNLVILNLANNPCCKDPDLHKRVTCALPGLMILDGEPVDPTLRSAAVEESGVIVREQQQTHGDRENDDGRVTVTLYVTVHAEDGGSNVVPLSFSSADNVLKKANQFCLENNICSEAARQTLTSQMEEAISGNNSGSSRQVLRPSETPESTGTALGSNERLQAIVNLQKARARVLEESTASFEQHKQHLLCTTRKAVERKTAAAQGRSNELEEGIRKILDDARSELQLRRARVSAENRQFAADMRRKVDKVLTERRQESEASTSKGVAASLPNAV